MGRSGNVSGTQFMVTSSKRVIGKPYILIQILLLPSATGTFRNKAFDSLKEKDRTSSKYHRRQRPRPRNAGGIRPRELRGRHRRRRIARPGRPRRRRTPCPVP